MPHWEKAIAAEKELRILQRHITNAQKINNPELQHRFETKLKAYEAELLKDHQFWKNIHTVDKTKTPHLQTLKQAYKPSLQKGFSREMV